MVSFNIELSSCLIANLIWKVNSEISPFFDEVRLKSENELKNDGVVIVTVIPAAASSILKLSFVNVSILNDVD